MHASLRHLYMWMYEGIRFGDFPLWFSVSFFFPFSRRSFLINAIAELASREMESRPRMLVTAEGKPKKDTSFLEESRSLLWNKIFLDFSFRQKWKWISKNRGFSPECLYRYVLPSWYKSSLG